ncbi:YggS family pyridoxal phosphate-dependent enzyme [Pedobacter aquatilis]|uniref:YggS family pyridoxal phosphate-dependent enzyme n=1 Tax=Pedobacter aquatilis TaxID=351343 RepID=UPI002930FDC2|nr:YggS family pyridoxal phosphate-dependent enzyme [Pedobacter aquatilis]
MKSEIEINLEEIHKRIHKACKNAGRSVDEVKLLLATKTVSAQRISVALVSGNTLIAENRIQELKEKYDDLKGIAHTNHFIGHLQSNKIKELLRYDVVCLQSLDNKELADKLNARLELEDKSIEVFIQVNTSNEQSKFGIKPADAIAFARYLAGLNHLKVKGLMTIGLLSGEDDRVRACFKVLKYVQQQIREAKIDGVYVDELSMGMSGDLEIAIEEGATIVRVGTAVFGTRTTPDSFYWNESL